MRTLFKKIFTRFCAKNPQDITLQNLCNFIPKDILSALNMLPKYGANYSIVDEFLGFCEASDADKTNGLSRKRAEAIPKRSPQDKFAFNKTGGGI